MPSRRKKRAGEDRAGGGPPGLLSGAALRLVLRGGLIYALVYLLWLPLRGWFIRLISAMAAPILRLIEQPPIIASLGIHGPVIVIRSYLTGLEQSMTTWNGWFLHIYVMVSLALVLSIPLRSRLQRARLLVLTSVVVFVSALAITVVQLEIAAEEHAMTHLGITLHTHSEKLALVLVGWLVALVGMLLYPASLLYTSYAAQRADRAVNAVKSGRTVDTRSRSRARLGAVGLAAVIAVGIGAWIGLATGRSGPEPRDYLPGWEKILTLNPTYVPALVNVGVGRDESGRTDEAIEAYRTALTLEPDNLSARYNLGNALVKKELFDEAARSFEEVLRRDPEHAGANKNLGIALLYLGRPCEALSYLERSTELDPEARDDSRVHEQIRRLRPLCPSS